MLNVNGQTYFISALKVIDELDVFKDSSYCILI